MTQDELKRLVAEAALAYVPRGAVIGIGSGSTVNHFIDVLAEHPGSIAGAVSSSAASTARLVARGLPVRDAGEVESLPLCVDGADEIDASGCMIKGGGAALTREKIVADLAERFVCIADETKLVKRLGSFPLPVEVIALAAPQVARRFAAIGDPLAMEAEVNQWPGVVTVGIFARHRATVCLLGTAAGVKTLRFA